MRSEALGTLPLRTNTPIMLVADWQEGIFEYERDDPPETFPPDYACRKPLKRRSQTIDRTIELAHTPKCIRVRDLRPIASELCMSN